MKVKFIIDKAGEKAKDLGLYISKDNNPIKIELPHLLGSNAVRSFEVTIREIFMEEENEKSYSKKIKKTIKTPEGFFARLIRRREQRNRR